MVNPDRHTSTAVLRADEVFGVGCALRLAHSIAIGELMKQIALRKQGFFHPSGWGGLPGEESSVMIELEVIVNDNK